MESTINQRIEAVIKHFKYKSIRAFADKIGVAQTSLNDIVRKNAEPKHGTIEKILKAEPLISSEWLLTGNGPMLKIDQPTTVQQSSRSANYQGTFTEPINTVIGSGNITGSENKISYAQQKKAAMLGRITNNDVAQLRQENEKLKGEVEKLKMENEHLKMTIDLQKSFIEEKERMIKILLEKK